METEPGQPARAGPRAGVRGELGDRVVPTDRGHRSLVVVLERLGRTARRGDGRSGGPTCRPPWIAGWATWGSGAPSASSEAAMSPIANTSGWPGSDRSGSTITTGPRGPFDRPRLGERVGPHTGGPHHRLSRDQPAVGELAPRSASTRSTPDAEEHLDPPPGEGPPGPFRRAGGGTARAAGRPPRPAPPAPGGRRAPGSRGQHPGEQLINPPAISTPVGPPPQTTT